MFCPAVVLRRIFTVFVCLTYFLVHIIEAEHVKNQNNDSTVSSNLYRTQNPPSNSQRHDARTAGCKIVNPCPSTLHNNTHENWSPGGLNQLINTDNKIILSSSTPNHQHNSNVSPIKYTVNELYKLKDASLAHRVSDEVRKRVSELGIKKRVRGRRAGRHMHKKIPVHIASTFPSSPVNTTSQEDLRKLNRTLVPIPKSDVALLNVSTSTVRYDFPSFFFCATPSPLEIRWMNLKPSYLRTPSTLV